MGVITDDRFNPIKAFCSVRLQQGVPLVDADVNELDDIRKFEVRAFLKWFVGNGIPEGNDGFRIAAATTPAADDFRILVSEKTQDAPPAAPSPAANQYALQNHGRCIVDGLDVIIQGNTTYKGQPLYKGQPGAVDRAKAWGDVDLVADIPTDAGPILVYLDVWERLVTPTEDKGLVVPQLGTESCARLKREWVVRTQKVSEALPASKVIGKYAHVYYPLAVINRRVSGVDAQSIIPADIVDRREKGLQIAPTTLIQDTLGVSASEYRNGKGRPAVSLREALNALLRGEVPATKETSITGSDTSNNLMSYAFGFDPAGGVNAIWTSNRNLANNQIFGARRDASNPDVGFSGLVQITSPASPHLLPSAAALPNGELIVAYCTSLAAPAQVFFKHAASLAAMSPSAPAENPVKSATNTAQHQPFVVATGTPAAGGTVVFFFHETGGVPTGARWLYQRRAYKPGWDEVAAVWTDPAGLPLSTTLFAPTNPQPTGGDFHAAADGAGNVWAAFRTAGNSIAVSQLTLATNALTTMPEVRVGASTVEQAPFVLADASSNVVWIFWQSNTGIFSQQITIGAAPTATPPASVPDTGAGTTHANPCAVRDATGAIWLFWESDRGGTGNTSIWFNRRGALGWGAARQITASTQSDTQPFAMFSPDGTIWLFWRRATPPGATNPGGALMCKQIITAL